MHSAPCAGGNACASRCQQVITEGTAPYRILYVSDGWQSLTGFSRNDALGRSLAFLQVSQPILGRRMPSPVPPHTRFHSNGAAMRLSRRDYSLCCCAWCPTVACRCALTHGAWSWPMVPCHCLVVPWNTGGSAARELTMASPSRHLTPAPMSHHMTPSLIPCPALPCLPTLFPMPCQGPETEPMAIATLMQAVRASTTAKV